MNGNQGEKVWPQMGRCVLRALSGVFQRID